MMARAGSLWQMLGRVYEIKEATLSYQKLSPKGMAGTALYLENLMPAKKYKKNNRRQLP